MIVVARLKKYIKKMASVIFKILGLDFVLGALGYVNIYKKNGYHYVFDYYGRSSAKQADIRSLPEFGALATKVIQHGRTYLYYDRLFTIYQAIKNLAKRGDELNFAEVGVYRGGTTYFMALAANTMGYENVTLYSFDTFEGHSPLDVRLDMDPYHRPNDFSNTEYSAVKHYLGEFGNVHVIKGRFQDTCSEIENKKFHFVHLDVDIYDPTLFALNFFDKLLDDNAAIVVDDYGFQTCPGIKAAVDEFVSNNHHYFFLELLTGQAILIKTN